MSLRACIANAQLITMANFFRFGLISPYKARAVHVRAVYNCRNAVEKRSIGTRACTNDPPECTRLGRLAQCRE